MRTKAAVDEIVRWVSGYSQWDLEALLADETDFETFFDEALETSRPERCSRA